MIFVSSSCVKGNYIKDSVSTLAKAGFKNIELSGGTEYYTDLEIDLLRLKDKYELNYLLHNYFPPPPQNHFVINLASLDSDIYECSIAQCKTAIELSKILGGKKYAMHAGFLVDIRKEEIGSKITFTDLNDSKKAVQKMKEAWKILKDTADDQVELYLENNVYSKTNKKTFLNNNPFLFSNYEGMLTLKSQMEFQPLLDLAHLKVSTNVLGLNFKDQIEQIIPFTDYLHISGNDGFHDQNLGISDEIIMLEMLKKHGIRDRTITIEIYGNMADLIIANEMLLDYA
jgi:sugar phosphate isomerase/epimerase